MAYGKVADEFYDHPKVEPLRQSLEGLAAVGLWALALSYANRFLTDGALTASRPGKLAEGLDALTTDALTRRLVVAGLWERTGDGGFHIHDFLVLNDSRADVIARREADAERMRTLRRNRARGDTTKSRPAERTAERPARRSRERAQKPDDDDMRPAERADERSPNVRPNYARGRARLARSGGPATNPVPSSPVPSVPTVESLDPSSSSLAGAREASAGSSFADRIPRPGGVPELAGRRDLSGTTTIDGAWASFTQPEWAPFRAAWEARGFRLPPYGSATDEADGSQRARLWAIASSRPASLAKWVAEAPAKAKARDVVGHVFREWNALRASLGLDVDDDDDGGTAARVPAGPKPKAGPGRAEAAAVLGEIEAPVGR